MIEDSTIKGITQIAIPSITFQRDDVQLAAMFDSMSRPRTVILELAQLTTDQMNHLLDGAHVRDLVGHAVSATLEDGRYLRTTPKGLVWVKPVDGSTLSVCYHIAEATISPSAPVEGPAGAWQFLLSNVSFTYGDETTRHLSQTGIKFQHDTIRFDVAGRDWLLRDLRHGTAKSAMQQEVDSHRPVASGMLGTVYREGDTVEAVGAAAEDIASLLSFALSRCVRWVRCTQLGPRDEPLTTYACSPWLAGIDQGDTAVIHQEQTKELKTFLESAYPKYAADREWFSRTLDLHLQSRMTSILDVKAILLNVLLERVSTRVVGTKFPPQIDKDLPARLDDPGFVQELHKLLAGRSDKWLESQTKQICETIKLWNSGPSLTKRVQMACSALGLEEPASKLIKPRNPILHLGEVDVRYENVFEYWRELDALMVLMLLRTLGYDGPLYHLRFGATTVQMRDLLKPPAAPAPGA